jgi:hypothetical protein
MGTGAGVASVGPGAPLVAGDGDDCAAGAGAAGFAGAGVETAGGAPASLGDGEGMSCAAAKPPVSAKAAASAPVKWVRKIIA